MIHQHRHRRQRWTPTHACDIILGSASERANGQGAVWAKSGHLAQCYHDMALARLGQRKLSYTGTTQDTPTTLSDVYHI